MGQIIDLCKWSLGANIRVKNAASLLAAILSLPLAYFVFRHEPWFRELAVHGATALTPALILLVLSAFLAAWLLFIGAGACWAWADSRRRQRNLADAERARIHHDLEGLTPWQWDFLLRYIAENRTQIPEWEVGPYRAAWDFEIGVLMRKGIVKQYEQVYEISPVYWQFLRRHWNSERGALE